MQNNSFYCDAILNRCVTPCDNSPTFTNPPVAIICVGQNFVFNHGGLDMDLNTSGGLLDSLSYSWTIPMGYNGSALTYSSPYAVNKSIYFWGFPNVNLPFPRGFHLDPTTGDISFRPMKIEQTVMALKVEEWRNINGTMTLIGQIRRDLQIIVISCPNNNAPYLSGPFYKEICATNTVNFSIATNDYDTKDTLLVSWNGAIPGASWSDNNKQVKHPTGTMSWTPGEQHASSIPYVFTVTVKDDACPVNGSSTRAYQILVKPLPKANITVIDSGCGDYYLYAQAVVGNGASFTWVGNFNPGFVYAGPSMHYKFKGPGKYPYTLQVEAQQCQRVYFDTIEVDTFLMLALTPDFDICYGDTSPLTAGFLYNTGAVSFDWSTGDTSQTINYAAYSDTVIGVAITDTMGCVAKDSVHINMHNLPLVDLGPDRRLCSYSTATIPVSYSFDQGGLQTISWYDKTNSLIMSGQTAQITISDSGRWICTVEDTLGCIEDDTLYAVVSPEMNAYAAGAVICYGDTATLTANSTGSKTANVQYRWYNKSSGTLIGITQTIKVMPVSTTDYKLLVKETMSGVECRDSFDLRVRVNPLPEIQWGTIPERCVDGVMLSLNTYLTTNPIFATKTWTSPSQGLLPGIYPGDKFNPLVGGAGIHKVVVTVEDPTTQCVSKDSNFVVINALPQPNAGADVAICTGDGAYFLDGKPSLPEGTWRSISGKGVEGSPGSYEFNPNASGVSNGNTYRCIYHYIDTKTCENEDTVEITVYETPIVNAGSDRDVCVGSGLVNLGGNPVGGKWSGKGVNVNTSTFDPDDANTGVGSYDLTYTYTNVICTVEDKITINVHPLPSITVGTRLGVTTFCSNYNLQELVGTPVGGTWTGPAGAIKFDKFFDPGINVGTAQVSYDLTYTYIDQYGCENSKVLTVSVRPEPSILIDKNASSLCYPEQYNVSATFANADGVQWYLNPDSAAGSYVTLTTNTTVEYLPHTNDLNRLYFWLNIKTRHPDNVCAPAYDSIRVNMSAIPSSGFAMDPVEGCNPHTVNFSDSSSLSVGNIVIWEWNFGDGNTSTLQNPSHTYVTPGEYSVMLRVKSNANCADEQTNSVYSRVVPDAGFIPEPELVLLSAPVIQFTNTTQGETPGIKYSWMFDDPRETDGGTSDLRDPEYKYRDTGTHCIVLYAINEYGCENETERCITVMPDVLAYVPSAFSPNGSGPGVNDTFRVDIDGFSEFELKVYSQWGELLYESTDYATHGWDGSYLNTDDKVPMDVYVYVMRVKGLDGIDYKYSGTVTLVK
jgi:PKD repeat protein